MSGIYDVTLANGATANMAALGSYVKVTSAPAGSVQVKLDGGEAFSLMEGQGVRLPDGKTFRDVAVRNTSGATQLVLLFIGDARFEDTRIAGSVRVIDEISDRANYQVQGALSLAVTAFSTLQLVDPATNVRGLILRQFQVTAAAGGGGSMLNRIVAAKAAPTSVSLPAQQWVPAQLSNSTTTPVSVADAFRNKLLPPGWGLYFSWVIAGAAAGTNYCELTTELL